MSNLHKKTKHHELCSCEPTAYKCEYPENEETSMSQQEKANMITSLQKDM
jgi:hypothetical protein